MVGKGRASQSTSSVVWIREWIVTTWPVVVVEDTGSWSVTGWAVKLRFMNIVVQIWDVDVLDDDDADATATVPYGRTEFGMS